ncbi:hypothetical protein V8E51_019068 [Hyaloscypha variabilis]
MENLGRASPSRTETYQYAVPVTIESISKGFVAHKFLIYRHYIPQMRMFHRALYIIENPHSSSRRMKRQLPSEIINIITQYVKAAAVEQGFLDSERQIRTSVYVELEEGLRRLERWAASTKMLEARPPEDTFSKFMMERYSLSIMPGMWDCERLGRSLRHLFLCYSPPESLHPFKFKRWNPWKHSHPSFWNRNLIRAQCSTTSTVGTWSGYWNRHPLLPTIYILERSFVEKTLASDSIIGRAVREMRLDIVSF